MKVFWLFLISLVSVLTVEYTFEDTICVLNSENFDYTFSKFRYVVVQFYTTNETLPQYVQTAQDIKETIPGMTFCKLNVTANIKYKDLYHLDSFPATKFFIKTNEHPATYEGSVNSDDITSWLRTQLEPLVTKILSLEELHKITSEEENENIGIYVGSNSSDAFEILLNTLPSFDDVVFVISNAEDVKQMYDADGDTFLMSRNHTQEVTRFPGNFTAEAFKQFIVAYKDPLILPLDQKTIDYLNNKLDKDVVFLIKADANNQEDNVFRAIAEELRGNLSFVIASKNDTHRNNVIKFFDLKGKEDKLPVVAANRFTDKSRYILDRAITVKNVEIFLENFFQDNLVPLVKSAEVPRDQYDGDVRVVVQKNFKEVVFDESKDVLIEFYNPLCGHCIAFAPTYSQFATTLKEVTNLVVAKIDYTVNRVEGVHITGFPTVMLYPRGGKDKPIKFSDSRTVEALTKFIKEKGTVKIDESIGA